MKFGVSYNFDKLLEGKSNLLLKTLILYLILKEVIILKFQMIID